MLRFKMLQGAAAAATCLGVTLATGGQAAADQVIADDLIVQGSICTGFDCVNNESFGFDTIILKENNLRIFFDDTSVGSFPANDWRLIANDSASGGANFFAIEDSTAARQVFRVSAGAPANSIFLSSTGNVGFGTAAPVLDLHVRTGDSPAQRFEQDASAGFTAQTWDIAGNEANFFIRDVTGGSRLPFRIRPGAPTSSIDINAAGNVGIGTASPAEKLHVVNGADSSLRLETTGASVAKWNVTAVSSGGSLVVKDVITGNFPLRIRPAAPTGSLDIRADGNIQIAALPGCTNGIKTNAVGVLACIPSPSPPRAGLPSLDGPGSALSARVANASASGSVNGQPGASGAPGTDPHGSDGTVSDTCKPGDVEGTWSLIGTNIEGVGTGNVLWCDVALAQAQDRPSSGYTMSGSCRSHAANDSTPERFTIAGTGSIGETAACTFGGSFKIKQGGSTVGTVSILEGRIEGPAARKSRAVAVSRMRRGRTSAIQTLVMQR